MRYAGYEDKWDDWINSSARVRPACEPDGLVQAPSIGTTVEVQLIQRALFWTPGTVRGLAPDGWRIMIELHVDRDSEYYAPSDLDCVHVPLRFLRYAGTSFISPLRAGLGPPAAFGVSGAGLTFVNGICIKAIRMCCSPITSSSLRELT